MTEVWPGQQRASTPTSEYNADRFHILGVLNRVSTATLVKVTKVSNKGEVKPVGTVNVQPLVNMQDGLGKQYKHAQAFNLPYFRLQGAEKGVILDPKVGDIGVAVFADRDISSVKRTKKQGPPGSRRRFSMADGLFFPCFLGDKPTSYLRFTDEGYVITSPDDGQTYVELQPNWIKLQVPGRSVHVRPNRVDLGKLDAPHAVMTADGPSLRVFAVIDEGD